MSKKDGLVIRHFCALLHFTWSSGGDGGVGGAMVTWFLFPDPEMGGSERESSRRSWAASVSSLVWILSDAEVIGTGTVGKTGCKVCCCPIEGGRGLTGSRSGGDGDEVDEGGENEVGGWGLMLARISGGSGVVVGSGDKLEKFGSSFIFLSGGCVIKSWSGWTTCCGRTWTWPEILIKEIS